MKITVYGGSFDPPHIAHEKIIQSALKTLDQDLLIILVAYQNPLKSKPRFKENLRLFWMQKLCENLPKTMVSDLEITNKIHNTIDSILLLKKHFNPSEINLIIGSDYAQSLHLWDGFNELKKYVNFILAIRSGFENHQNKNVNFIKNLDLGLKKEISSTKIYKDIALDLIPKKIVNLVQEELTL